MEADELVALREAFNEVAVINIEANLADDHDLVDLTVRALSALHIADNIVNYPDRTSLIPEIVSADDGYDEFVRIQACDDGDALGGEDAEGIPVLGVEILARIHDDTPNNVSVGFNITAQMVGMFNQQMQTIQPMEDGRRVRLEAVNGNAASFVLRAV